MILIAGLGNPGPLYSHTRHNVGFRVVEMLSREGRFSKNQHSHRAVWVKVNLWGKEVVLAKPLTYMNRSGWAIAPLLKHLGLEPRDLLVIYDDLALPLGKLRLRRRGSSGGHKGVASIIELLGTEEFPRLRLGIGSPPAGEEAAEHVLADFLPSEEEEVNRLFKKACQGVEILLTEGMTKAMDMVNGPGF